MLRQGRMNLLVEEFLQYLTVERGYAPLTIMAYRADLAQFIAFAKAPLEKATRQTIEAFARDLRQQGLLPRSVARKLAALKSFRGDQSQTSRAALPRCGGCR